MANTNPFEIALIEARKALAAALEERSAIEQRIVNLKQTIDGLSALCEPESEDELVQVSEGAARYNTSLTDAIRVIFSEATEPLTPPEVRDALASQGVNLSKYKQPLVPIHNTLKRLVSQEELVEFRDDNGDLRGYRWVSPLARAVAEVHPYANHPLRGALGPGPRKRQTIGQLIAAEGSAYVSGMRGNEKPKK